MIPAIIIAAGRSTRMGRPKPLLLLPPDGATFIERLTRSLLLGGVADVLVVVRPDDRALADEIERLASSGCAVRTVENADADRGQLSSVVVGLNAADRPGVHGVALTPVDAPLIRPATVRALLDVFASGPVPLVRATYRGRHGHPVIFSRMVFDALRRADPAIGARAVVHAHAADLIDVEVDDPAVVLDVDNPDDYARMMESAPG
jgi:molybdenum cofactor cytidylyltransferase